MPVVIFPIDIVTKQNNPDLEAQMSGQPPEYVYTAEEWNLLRDAINTLYSMVTTGNVKYVGDFASVAALEAAYPVASPGSRANIINLEADDDLAVWDDNDQQWFIFIGQGGVSETTFVTLTDTPENYSGSGGKVVAVKSDASGLEFVNPTKQKTITSNVTLDNTYNNCIVKIKADSSITIPSGLSSEFNCVFRTFTGIAVVFTAGSGVTLDAPDGTLLEETSMCTLFKDGSTETFVLEGELTT